MRGWALLCAAALLGGCQQKTTAPAAVVEGSLDLALVGDLLFVTASDTSELRALDLTRSPRDFVRAPNPLAPLSIPVIDRPQVLARDVRYADEPAAEDGTAGRQDQETSGPYLYVLGAGGAEVSVVHAARSGPGSLTEVARLKPPGSVSAMAAIGPGGGRPSRLFLAVSRASGTDLMEYQLPAPEALGASLASPRTVAFIAEEWVNAMVVVPVGRGLPEQLAVATRKLQGRGGQTVLVDPSTRRVRALAFPGPMRLLATHAASALAGLRAGRFLWGALDEDACGGSSACEGLVAVDLDTGAIASRNAQAPNPTPMPVLGTGEGLPMGLTLTSDASLNLPGIGVGEFGVLGVVTTSTGQMFFFDGERLRHLDVNYDGPGPLGIIYRGPPTAEAPSGTSLEYRAGPIVDDPQTQENENTIALADGAARDEVISIVYQGLVPDLVLPTQPADGPRFPGPGQLLRRARVGDRLLVADEVGALCDELAVAAIEPGALVADRAPSCPRRARFSVRAGGDQPYVVVGSVSGYLGRTRPSDPAFAAERSPYFNLPANPVETQDLAPLVQFRMGPEVPAAAGSRFDLDTQANFAAFGITASLPEVTSSLHIAARPVYDRPPHGQRAERLYVAFPAANGILGVIPTLVQRGENGGQKLEFYR